MWEYSLSSLAEDLAVTEEGLTLARRDGQPPAVLLRCDPALPAPLRERLLAHVAAALSQTAGFTTSELEHGVVERLVETGPLQSEWLVACREEMGAVAFMRCCPANTAALAEYGDRLDTLLPLLSQRLERESRDPDPRTPPRLLLA